MLFRSSFSSFALFCALIPTAPSAFAQSEPRGCGTINRPDDILECALSRAPEARRAGLERSQNERLEDQARQRPNPELNSQFGFIPLDNEASNTAQLSLLHTFELGGKRGARIERARAELVRTDAEVMRARESVIRETLLSLHRIRQIEEELGVLNETIETFEKQSKLLRSRPNMAPEQDVSSWTFTLAAEDTAFKKNVLENEKHTLIRGVQTLLADEVPYAKSWLPEDPRAKWPGVEAVAEPSIDFSGMRNAGSEVTISKAEWSLAKSAAWADLQVGPFFDHEWTSGVRSTTLGLQLTLPLPLYHRNGGGKAYARAGLLRAEQSFEIAKNALFLERKREVDIYRNALDQLGKSRWHEEYTKRHERLESLFKRGVLSSPIVIEAHRQIIEVQRSSHEVELRALDALYRIRILDGKKPEVSL